MKKVLQFAGLIAAIMALVMIREGRLYARITGTPPTSADIVCFGPSALEVCIDASANIVPTTTGVGSLGTSTLKFNQLNISGAASMASTVALGAIGVAGAAGSGNTTGPTATTITGTLALAKANVGTNQTAAAGIYVSTTLPVLTSYETLLSSGGGLFITALPSIATATVVGGTTALDDGTILILTSTSPSNIYLQDNGTLSGSQLELGAASRIITANKVLKLIYVAPLTKWMEVSYGNN